MDSIRFKNYRCFSDTGDIALKPLTFLLGANSSGKSSFLEFFPLLKQSVGVRRNGIFLWYANDVDFKDFGNAVMAGKEKMHLSWTYDEFSIRGNMISNRVKRWLKDSNLPGQNVTIRLSMTLLSGKDNFDRLENLIISFLDEEIILNVESDGKVLASINGRDFSKEGKMFCFNDTSYLLPRFDYVYKTHGTSISTTYYRELDKEELLAGEDMKDFKEFIQYEDFVCLSKDDYMTLFKSIVKKEGLDYEYLRDLYILAKTDEIIESINYRIQAEAYQLSYVKPLRVMPERYYRYQNYSVDEIDSDGKNLAMFLANLSDNDLKAFQKWTSANFKFKIYPSKHKGHIELTIGENKKDARNLVDVGFGYTQLLPIITIIWNALRARGRRYYYPRGINSSVIIAIEQPELHLHPHIQSLFAEMLARVVSSLPSNIDARFIIETHSEAIINRIGSMVQSGELSSEKVNVVLFNRSLENKNPVVETSFDKDGYLKEWPLGFFM